MGFSLLAMWRYDCPRCRQSKIFTEPFNISDPIAMPRNCKVCSQRTEPEPGFYYGAMFVSYIISSFGLLLPTLFLIFYFKWSVMGAVSFAIFLAVITYIRLLRLSRSLWLHLNVKYDPTYAGIKKEPNV